MTKDLNLGTGQDALLGHHKPREPNRVSLAIDKSSSARKYSSLVYSEKLSPEV